MLRHVRRLLVVAQGVHKLVLIDGARVVFVDQVEERARLRREKEAAEQAGSG